MGNDTDDKKCITNSRYVSDLRPIEEIPHRYQKIYSNYPCFNYVQSVTFDDLFYTDDSIVVSAPTGSGKTTIFELAIIRSLITYEGTKYQDNFKMVYIAPMKALCEERLVDWHRKFSEYGVNCISVTGDSDNIDIKDLICNNLIITTPERWDSLTRKWKDNQQFVELIKLFMIDEIHLLGDENRGAVLEIIVCRMKTIENSLRNCEDFNKIRFIAVSATIPNIEDIAEWIDEKNVKYFKFADSVRPVQLNKIVYGYYYNPKSTYFKFDLALNYKLQNLILQHSEGKPTLIFCSTRKIVEMTAQHLVKHLTINLNVEQKRHLQEAILKITDCKLKEILIYGIGYHHAGMLPETKSAIENLFRSNNLPILVTTSTLSLGINLPAHLVIIKSTKMYQNGQFINYTDTTILQMIGRAGRPQYDQTATAIILTTQKDKDKYEKLFENTQIIESNLHKHLIEHLNAEICLKTITNLDIAMLWLTSTFLYIRARKQPKFYGILQAQTSHQIDKKLLEMCQIELNKLAKVRMLTIDLNMNLEPTLTGQLMAKYYLAFETVKLFTQLKGDEILQQILNVISKCHEFSEMYLRVNDKKYLNLLNKCKNRQTIRFPFQGKIRTLDMKINCLIQAVLGCLDISDHSLLAETLRIMRNAERIIKGLIEYLEYVDKYQALLNSIILSKCFKAKLWEDSPYLTKQLNGIGNVISKQLADNGKNTFDILLQTNPREIEMIINKKSPIGDRILDEITHLPKYSLKLNRINTNKFELILILENPQIIDNQSTININSLMYLLIGDSTNNIRLYEKYTHSYMIAHPRIVRNFEIDENIEFIEANFISDDWVGIDVVSKIDLIIKKDIEKPTKKCKQVSKNKNDTYLQTFIDKYMQIKKQITKNDNNKKQQTIDKIDNNNKENLAVVTNKNPIVNTKIDVEKFRFAPKKLSHQQQQQQQDEGEIEQKQQEINPPKKFKLNDNDNVDKNVKWRSPLIYSPPVKFSPKLIPNNNNDSGKLVGNEEIVEKNSQTSTSSNISNELLIKTTQLQQQKQQQRSTLQFLPTIKLNSSKGGAIFPLSDKDYLRNDDDDDDDNSTLSIEDRDSFFSSSFLEKLGILQKEKGLQLQYQQQSQQSQQSQRSDRIKSRSLSAVDYYSELVTQKKQEEKKMMKKAKCIDIVGNQTVRIVEDLQEKSSDIPEFNFDQFNNKRPDYTNIISPVRESIVSLNANNTIENQQNRDLFYRNRQQQQQQPPQHDSFRFDNNFAGSVYQNFDNNLILPAAAPQSLLPLPPPLPTSSSSSLPIINQNYQQQMHHYYDRNNNFDNSSYRYLRRIIDIPSTSPITDNMMIVNHRYGGINDNLQLSRIQPQSQPLPQQQQQQWNFQSNLDRFPNYFYQQQQQQQNTNLYNPQQQQQQQQEMLKNYLEQDYRNRQFMMEKFLKSCKYDQQNF